jgi:preprotein translocase subunit SecD
MKVYARQFNLYLTWFTALMLICGCASSKKDGKDDKDATGAIRVHIESPLNLAGTGQAISLTRTDPVTLNIQSDPILTEASLVDVHLIDLPGGAFAVEIGFDEIGTYTLEQFTAANPGRRLAIFGQWGDKLNAGRWLAAPLINHRITKGQIIFTPDANREEALKLVTGLSNVAKKNVKAMMK